MQEIVAKEVGQLKDCISLLIAQQLLVIASDGD
jgi:hypothetical protein